MAFNPALAKIGPKDNDMAPFLGWGERLVLKRVGINAQLKVDRQTFSGKGYLFLTTSRCVFIKEGAIARHKHWSSLDLPLAVMSDGVKFHQPVFGANYLEGTIAPAPSAQYPFAGAGTWSLTFKEGGCAKFIKAFYALHGAVKRAGTSNSESLFQTTQNAVTGFVDPSDPTVIFLHQPAMTDAYTFDPATQGYQPAPNPGAADPRSAYPGAVDPRTGYPGTAYTSAAYPGAAYPGYPSYQPPVNPGYQPIPPHPGYQPQAYPGYQSIPPQPGYPPPAHPGYQPPPASYPMQPNDGALPQSYYQQPPAGGQYYQQNYDAPTGHPPPPSYSRPA